MEIAAPPRSQQLSAGGSTPRPTPAPGPVACSTSRARRSNGAVTARAAQYDGGGALPAGGDAEVDGGAGLRGADAGALLRAGRVGRAAERDQEGEAANDVCVPGHARPSDGGNVVTRETPAAARRLAAWAADRDPMAPGCERPEVSAPQARKDEQRESGATYARACFGGKATAPRADHARLLPRVSDTARWRSVSQGRPRDASRVRLTGPSRLSGGEAVRSASAWVVRLAPEQRPTRRVLPSATRPAVCRTTPIDGVGPPVCSARRSATRSGARGPCGGFQVGPE